MLKIPPKKTKRFHLKKKKKPFSVSLWKRKNGNLTLRNPGVGCWAPLTRAPVCVSGCWEATAWGSRDSLYTEKKETHTRRRRRKIRWAGGWKQSQSCERGERYTMPVVDCRPSSWPVHVPTHSEIHPLDSYYSFSTLHFTRMWLRVHFVNIVLRYSIGLSLSIWIIYTCWR